MAVAEALLKIVEDGLHEERSVQIRLSGIERWMSVRSVRRENELLIITPQSSEGAFEKKRLYVPLASLEGALIG